MSGEVTRLVLLANAASTLILVGLIWFVQVVHYPQFARVGRERFAEYQAAHMRMTTWVVVAPMLVEAGTAAVLAWWPPSHDLAIACWAGLALVAVIWISTALLQMPRHQALAIAFDEAAHRELVRSNWVRTIAWSVRGGLLLFVLSRVPPEALAHGG